MIDRINWLAWLILVILWNYGYPDASPLLDVDCDFAIFCFYNN